MRRVVAYILVTLAALAAVSIYISFVDRQSQLNHHITNLAYKLKNDAQKYTRCYYSVNNGGYLISDVSLAHLKYNSTDGEKARLKQLEVEFMNGIKNRCNSIIANYESMYHEYRRKIEESSDLDWITFLIGGGRTIDSQLSDLSTIRFQTGDALTYFIFTKEDVELYFDKN